MNGGAQSARYFSGYLREQLAAGLLRGERLTRMARYIIQRGAAEPDWLQAVEWLLYMPRFLNVCAVSGACNCDCRMCGAGRGKKFEHLPAAAFGAMLANAPTAGGVTFSASDSDPLLNPELFGLLDVARGRGILCDFFTNGLALTPETALRLVASRAVGMINVSMDAATPETYRRIRRRDLDRVRGQVEGLVAVRDRAGTKLPRLSLSMVAMDDNIEELPALVEYAAGLGAVRVFVQALMDQTVDPEHNRSALCNPECARFVDQARAAALRLGLALELPAALAAARGSGGAAKDAPLDGSRAAVPPEAPASAGCDPEPPAQDAGHAPDDLLPFCSWMWGAWVRMDGRLSACCLHNGLDMGNLASGPLWENGRFIAVKKRLVTGAVYPACLEQASACPYLARRRAAGADIGALARQS